MESEAVSVSLFLDDDDDDEEEEEYNNSRKSGPSSGSCTSSSSSTGCCPRRNRGVGGGNVHRYCPPFFVSLFSECLSSDPAAISPRTLWITMAALAMSMAAFAACCTIFILAVLKKQQQDHHHDHTILLLRNSTLVAEAQDRWVHLRDYFNITTLVTPVSPQARALLYLSLQPHLHTNLPQLYALAVIYYTFGGPSWKLQENNEAGQWMVQQWPSSSTHGIDDGDHDYSVVSPPVNYTNSNSSSSSNYWIDAKEALQLECKWQGIRCDEQGNVISMAFRDNAYIVFAKGTIPTEFAFLTSLEEIAVSNHKLQGSIPTELAQLRQLTMLDLHSNQIHSAAAFLSHLTPQNELQTLRLSHNKIQETWRTQELEYLSQLANLKEFAVNDNPNLVCDMNLLDYAGVWPKMQTFVVSRTHLHCSVGDTLSLWPSLRRLELTDTPYSGTIPVSLSTAIESVSMGLPKNDTGLLGTVPTEIGLWTNLKELNLETNVGMQSTIPSEISQATSLQSLILRFNRGIHGTLPSGIGRLTDLNFLDVSDTSISGTVPAEFGHLKALTKLRFDKTNLEGTIPKGLCDGRAWIQFWANCVETTTSDSSSAPNRGPVVVCDCCQCVG